MAEKERIAFFGLGAIGFGMARNLVDAGYKIHITVHRNPENVDKLVNSGALRCASNCEAVDLSDVLIFCLPTSQDAANLVDEVWPVLRAGQVVLDTGTSSIVETRDLAKRLESKGTLFVESPVAGGKVQALAGELGAYVGADSALFDRIKPVLEQFCSSIEHFGPVGTGGRAKLVSNYLVLGMVRLVLETFHAADCAQIDWEQLYNTIRRGSANSGVLQRIIGTLIEDDHYRGYVFSVDNACKDLNYIAEMSAQLGLDSILNDSALKLFRSASKSGFGDLMISELFMAEVRYSLSELAGDESAHDDVEISP